MAFNQTDKINDNNTTTPYLLCVNINKVHAI